jgi:hypothetical protein
VAPPAPLPPEAEPFVELLREAGEPIVEHGILLGEVLGLEVVRVVVDEVGTDLPFGVGKHDREPQRLIHGDRPTPGCSMAAVPGWCWSCPRATTTQRHVTSPPHCASQLRWSPSQRIGGRSR